GINAKPEGPGIFLYVALQPDLSLSPYEGRGSCLGVVFLWIEIGDQVANKLLLLTVQSSWTRHNARTLLVKKKGLVHTSRCENLAVIAGCTDDQGQILHVWTQHAVSEQIRLGLVRH